jgi:SAM-dependent methyltransferase
MEQRATEPSYRAMVQDYLSRIDFPPDASVVEIGCGTGSVARVVARQRNVRQVVGIDPSPVFIEKARELAEGLDGVEFAVGDGRTLAFDDGRFDVAVVNTALTHVPQPERVIAEAFRVLRPTGWLAVFDGDYSTATVAQEEFDPLQACVAAFRANFVHDSWLVRRLPRMVVGSGFELVDLRSHGYVEAPRGGYMLTWIERGADVLLLRGCIGADSAEALKAEARRRSEESRWFGHIAFFSVIARRPA